MNTQRQVVPFAPQDFAWAAWSAVEIAKAADSAMHAYSETIAHIKHINAQDRTFENTIYAQEAPGKVVVELSQVFELLLNVSPKEEVRNAAQGAKEKIDAYLVEVAYDTDLYKAVEECIGKAEVHESDAQKFVHDMMRDYKRLGLSLPESDRTWLKETAKRLQELGLQFQLNINNYQDFITLTESETGGLTESYLKGLSRDEQGNYKVTLSYPDYIPFVKMSESDEKRKELVEKFNKKGGEENIKILLEARRLRTEMAQKLGYKNFQEYIAEVKTAKSARVIAAFLRDTAEPLKTIWQKEKQELFEFARSESKNQNLELGYWNLVYWETKQAKALFGIDPEEIREYFPMQHVLKELFALYGELFGLRFEKMEGVQLWHEDVELYQMLDSSGSLLSYFALDLYPREAKYDHAAEFPISLSVRQGLRGDSIYGAAMAGMVTNFPKDTADSPSLMPHDQVETLFHEFGHVIHQNLSHARFTSQAGTNVAGDFVEAPSQMLEYWVWEPEVLKRITKHYKTGQPMSDELINRLVKSKNHGAALLNIRQFIYGIFDNRFLVEDGHDPVKLYAELYRELQDMEPPTGQLFAAGFGHIMSGYEGGYYGYMWSKVFAADMFSRFAKEGVVNSNVGMEYRTKVLEVGSRRDEVESVADFLGRQPNNKAFLEELGLTT